MARNGTKRLRATDAPWPLVEIYWQDACADGDWRYLHELEPELKSVVSVGYLIRESKRSVTLAAAASPDPHGEVMFNDIQAIPKSQIVKRCTLRPGG